MQTTIDLPEELIQQAFAIADQKIKTKTVLIIEALKEFIVKRKKMESNLPVLTLSEKQEENLEKSLGDFEKGRYETLDTAKEIEDHFNSLI